MSDQDLWVVIPNWDKFQHYGDRELLWIRVYTELNRRDDWRYLSLATRGALTSLWLEYGTTRGVLRQRDCNARVGASIRQEHWDSLCDAGLVELSASKPLAFPRARARASARVELEVEKETPLPPTNVGGITCKQCGETRLKPNARCKACGASPRQAGTSTREANKPRKPSDYHRAETFTRNAGWQYLQREYADELSRYDLTDEQRSELEQLRASLANGTSSEQPTNPELDW